MKLTVPEPINLNCCTGKKDGFRIRRAWFVIKTVLAVCMICCLIWEYTCKCGEDLQSSHFAVKYTKIPYQVSETENGVQDYQNTIDANLEVLAGLYPGEWETKTEDEKLRILEVIIRIECRYLGTYYKSCPAFELANLGDGILGEYDVERDVITLSYDYFLGCEESGFPLVHVLTHESYHRYQAAQVELLRAMRDDENLAKYTDLLLLYDAGIYEAELENCITAAESPELYSKQMLEVEALRYSNDATAEYRERIRTYVETH